MRPFRGDFQGRRYDSPIPPPAVFHNHPAATSPEFAPFVRSKVREMASNGAIRRLGPVGVVPRPRVVLPVGVEPTKRRLICDARFVNQWCPDLPFSFEHLGMLPRLVQDGEPLFSIDHTSGYVHVRLTGNLEQFFGFEFDGDYYVYTTLSFGWKASPFIYNTLSGAVAQFFRWLSIRNLFYLDDSVYLPLLNINPLWSCGQHADAEVYIVCSVLTRLGYYVNLKKSHLLPCPLLVWLGFLIDTHLRTFSIPPAKLDKFIGLLRELLASTTISYKALERFVE
jgi:hypothetical protein